MPEKLKGAYFLCTKITPSCPVSATTYGYYPNVPANLFFAAFFGVLLIICLVLGIRSRAWSYTIALAMGLLLELAGYIGRYIMSHNPWNKAGYQLQIIALILAPSFIAASIYLTLKGLVLHFGPQHSLIKARLYPLVFVGCDIGSIVLQAIGGGIAAVAGNKRDMGLLRIGNALIITGIAFQVFTMAIFGVLAAMFFLRYRKAGHHHSSGSENEKTGKSPKIFCYSIVVAYTAILIRCIYRIPEMAGGWGGPLMRNEPEFLALDGAMIALATFALTIIHPGIFFPEMSRRGI